MARPTIAPMAVRLPVTLVVVAPCANTGDAATTQNNIRNINLLRIVYLPFLQIAAKEVVPIRALGGWRLTLARVPQSRLVTGSSSSRHAPDAHRRAHRARRDVRDPRHDYAQSRRRCRPSSRW